MPNSVKKLVKKGLEVFVQSGAGDNSNYSDSEYIAAGAIIDSRDNVLSSELIISIRMPEISELRSGLNLVCVADPFRHPEKINSCIINAGDGTHEHPSQALLDAFSLQEKFGDLGGRRIAIVGDILHSRVALSNIYAYQKLGAEVTVCGPKSLIPKYIESLNVKVETNLFKALKWCDAVNMLRIQNERIIDTELPSTEEYFLQYGLTAEKLKKAKTDALVMHPGPINRDVEIESSLADDVNKSVINEQVENGVAVRMACLAMLIS